MLDLIKKLLALVPASAKAVKEVLGIALKVLGAAKKLLPAKKEAAETKSAPAAEAPKCEGKCKCTGKCKCKKLGLLGVAAFVGVCLFKTVGAILKAKKDGNWKK